MKKFYSILSLLIATYGVNAQNVAITFQVDMNNQTVSSNGVHVAGSWQDEDGNGSDWDPAGTQLTDGDGDGVYTYTANIPAGTYEYKFINGNAWGGDESVPGSCAVNNNREIVVTTAATVPVVCFASCEACPTATDTVDVVLKVDMSQQTVSGNGVHVAGAFGAGGYPDWSPNGIQLTDANSDNIYETTLKLPQGTYQFKFINGDAWGGDESVDAACAVSNNRELKVNGDADDSSEYLPDAITYFVAFGQCVPVDSIDVTLIVGMENETVSDSGIHVAGAFGAGGYAEWNPGAIELIDGNNDKYYEVTMRLPEGTYQFKFVNGNAWGSEEGVPSACNVSNNRQIVVAGNGDAFSDVGATQEYKVCFGSCDTECKAPLPPINVTFRVDMSNEIVESSGLYVAGEFKGAIWDKDSFALTDNDGNDVWEVTINLDPKEYQFKFYNGDCGDDGCGEDYDFGAGGCGITTNKNRIVDLSNAENDTTLSAWIFNSCDLSTVSVSDISISGFEIYPNPASDHLTVGFNANGNEVTVMLLDMQGNQIILTQTLANNVELDLSDLAAGIYLVRVVSADGSATKKIIVE